jgi:histidinol phosphatase-like enzyme
VVDKIREWNNKEYMIVIFTNQGGIGKGLVGKDEICRKIEAVAN